EQGAVIGSSHQNELRLRFIPTPYRPGFPSDVDLAVVAAHRVKMQFLLIIYLVNQWRPLVAAIIGAKDSIKGANNKSCALVLEPYVEERLGRCVLGHAIRLAQY